MYFEIVFFFANFSGRLGNTATEALHIRVHRRNPR